MEDIDVLKAKLQVAEAKRFSKIRLYKYGLSSDDVNMICNYETLPQATRNQNPLTIQTLSSGQFGKADKITYNGKQYVRKTQNITIDPALAELFQFSPDFMPFINEIDVLKELSSHPIVSKYVPVYYGFSMSGNKGTYLMELLNGVTLQDLCDKRGLSQEEWDRVMSDITTMLTELHKAGYVFNDLHSENVFVLMDGSSIKSLVLIDFGLTKPVDEEKLKAYRVLQREFEEGRAKRNGVIRYKPEPNRNIPDLNFKFFDMMKEALKNPLQMRGQAAIPACIRNPDANFNIQFKPRDFDTGNALTAEQEREIATLTQEIGQLKFDIARQAPIQATLPYISAARQSLQNIKKRNYKQGLKNIGQTLKGFFRKGGKRKGKKTRKHKK